MSSTEKTQILKFIDLFNDGEYFEAHEFLEDYWNSLEKSMAKNAVQGLIQVAALMHLLKQGRIQGAKKVLARAKQNFQDITEFSGIDINELIQKISKKISVFNSSEDFDVKIASE